jgi:peptide deformylase
MIVRYPNQVLSKRTSDITVFDEELKQLVDQMIGEMYAEGGIGLAAPQLGKSMSVAVVAYPGTDRENALVLVNPKLKMIGKRIPSKEGCLSLPGQTFNVSRFSSIEVTFRDVNGQEHRQSYDGDLAIVIQHEYDHLAGITLIERATLDRRMKSKGKNES